VGLSEEFFDDLLYLWGKSGVKGIENATLSTPAVENSYLFQINKIFGGPFVGDSQSVSDLRNGKISVRVEHSYDL